MFTPPELDDPAALFALFATKYATVTTAVTETRAPATYATEFLTQFSLVAKKNELMICGPAIITKAIGRICAQLTADRPDPGWAAGEAMGRLPGAARERRTRGQLLSRQVAATIPDHIARSLVPVA